jgi:hypothetical protein
MALKPAANLYESLLQRGSASRLGDVTVLRMDGGGAIATPTLSFQMAMRWAQARRPSNSPQKDRDAFLEKVDLFISRTGSSVPTKGSVKPLVQLARSMEGAGLELTDWNIPSALKEALDEQGRKSLVTGVEKKEGGEAAAEEQDEPGES